MSTIVQMSKKPLVEWKGQTFDQIQSMIKKNDLSGYTVNTKVNYFRANPLKIYRREIVSNTDNTCNPRTSVKIDIFNRPNGTINNSNATNPNGLANNTQDNTSTNSCENFENCSVIMSPAEKAKNRVRSSGMIRKKFDSSRNTDNYYTSSKQYLDSRSLSFNQNQYNYIRRGDSTAKPGSGTTSQNVYSPSGLNHCKKYYISANTSFKYKWIDDTEHTVNVVMGYYELGEINQLLKLAMIANNHFYTKNQVGINPDPFKDILTFLLNISFDNGSNQVEFQSFRTDAGLHPPANYTIPNNEQSNPAWTQPASGSGKFPQFIVEDNIMQQAFGINNGTYPINAIQNNTYNYTIAVIGAANGNVYTFTGGEYTTTTNNPVLTFYRGSTYVLNLSYYNTNNNPPNSHPFKFQTINNGGDFDGDYLYTTGIVENGNTITFTVPNDAPDTLYYRCENHGNMGNTINILSDDNTIKTFHSTTNAGLQLKYSKLYYKPSNYQFANQGAVSAGDLITRRRYNTITDAAATYTNALGLSVANALAYGVPANGYTIKDKLGYPLKKTPTFNKYSDDMQKCTPTTFANIM